MNKKALLFNEVPEGTYYKKGMWSWVKEPKASEYINDGYAVVWDVKNRKPKGKPDSRSTVQEIKDYLKSEGVDFDSNALKSELLDLV